MSEKIETTKPADASAELGRLKERERKIKAKIALSGGTLTREQAEASVDNQAKFDKANAERKAKAKK